jgi:hypothetical protein
MLHSDMAQITKFAPKIKEFNEAENKSNER